MKQIAIYGKGGIGKSTTSANISFLLSARGLNVVQIGCDPKHDSTRLLLNGKTQTTILDHISADSKDHREVIFTGKNNVTCLETGGPEPGVGCAGRGILTAFDFIKTNSLIPDDTDMILYDVLGDVVCGGFAVPLRKQYANIVFIVTSGEFMSLYAANNVLKGIRNFDDGDRRVAGLILNSRGNEGEYDYVKNFADAVGLPIVAVIPRSKKFSSAESAGMTVAEMYPDSDETGSYRAVIDLLLSDDPGLHEASPLNDDDLDLVAKGIKVRRKEQAAYCGRKLAIDERSTLKSCGIRASARCCLEVLDCEVIAHGPMSCAYMYGNVYDRTLLYEGNTHLRSINERIFSTDLDDKASIYGGGKQLAELIENRISEGARLLFVMSACVPGIIGDDTVNICESVGRRHPEARIIPVPMDGILCGGAIQGKEMAVEKICSLVDMSVEPDRSVVNILGYADSEDRILSACDDTERILSGLGISVNCMFLHHNDSSVIAGMRKGSVNLLFGEGITLRREAKVITRVTGVPFHNEPLPRGLAQTKRWVRSFSSSYGIDSARAESLCEELDGEYSSAMELISGELAGTRALIYIDSSSDIEWLIEILDELGAEIVRIMCPVNSIWNFATDDLKVSREIPVEYGANLDTLRERIEELKPDFITGSHATVSTIDYPHYNFERPRPGIRGCVEHAKRIIRMQKVRRYEAD